MNSISFLLLLLVSATTTTTTGGAKPKQCRRKASKIATTFIDCYIKAELHQTKADKMIKKCNRKFTRKYNRVEALDGCTTDVIRDNETVLDRITNRCLTLGYDGTYCMDVTATMAIDATIPEEESSICTREIMECPYGGDDVYRLRDEFRSCSFTACCCDPSLEPGANGNPIGREGYACCPNGEWTNNNLGDGKTFFCPSDDGDVDSAFGTTGPFGRVCKVSTAGNEEDGAGTIPMTEIVEACGDTVPCN